MKYSSELKLVPSAYKVLSSVPNTQTQGQKTKTKGRCWNHKKKKDVYHMHKCMRLIMDFGAQNYEVIESGVSYWMY